MARRPAPAADENPLAQPFIQEALQREIFTIKGNRITYKLKQPREYDISDPEEPVRAYTIAWLVIVKGYPAARIRTEVPVPRRTPGDFADVVLYSDDRCLSPYLVVENKAPGQTDTWRRQGIEQAFGNGNSLRAPFVMYEEAAYSVLFDAASFPPLERDANRLGNRDALPSLYGSSPAYLIIAGAPGDISPASSEQLEIAVRRAHSIIWSGGKRDPLTAFDEWSKLLFAKVMDERSTPNGQARGFQVGTNETDTVVANRIHSLFAHGSREDPSIFPSDVRIRIPDNKVAAVVRVLQTISFTKTDADTSGAAFEQFFGSVFRGKLGQYFTRRELARFTLAMLCPTHEDFVIDPTAGSGGFLLEALLQAWHRIHIDFSGQQHSDRMKIDFALKHVYGIEIHEILARICKINLLLHHDGHTNIEGDRSCLDSVFSLPRLNPPQERFSLVVGNPPFGDEVKEGDADKLGENQLASFKIAKERTKVDSEHVILERSIQLLEPGGRLGMVIPDGLLNNQGWQSNCPQARAMLAKSGKFLAVVSLPDYAFRKSGAQNKTSVLFFQKFNREEKERFHRAYEHALASRQSQADEQTGETLAIAAGALEVPYWTFLAEAQNIGYSPSGGPWPHNDLYRDGADARLMGDQEGTVLGEFRKFAADPQEYKARTNPDCMAIQFPELWLAHQSGRIDPKYHLFKRQETMELPSGWVRLPLRDLMRRIEDEVHPEGSPRDPVKVMTISNRGEIRERQAGKGICPPEWLGMYFEDSPSSWYRAQAGDLVYSSIDLWKGCIAIVPEAFEGALVTKEFPIYRVVGTRIDPSFLSCLLRTRYYQRAFRAITTGHSNRRRTQQADFEALEIAFPASVEEQRELCRGVLAAMQSIRDAGHQLAAAQSQLDRMVDGREAVDTPVEEPDEGEEEE